MNLHRQLLAVAVGWSVTACGDDTASSGGTGPLGGADSNGGGGAAGGAVATGGMGGAPGVGGSPAGGAEAGGGETGGAPQSGPYTNCEMDTVACPTPGSICPFDSTGSVCAPPCDTVADCPALAGAVNAPECYEVAVGKFCIVPCLSGEECPDGMQCLSFGLPPQCAWE